MNASRQTGAVLAAPPELLSPLVWKRGTLYVLDQQRLPGEARWLACTGLDHVVQVIVDGHVRGAGAVACALGYGAALAAHERLRETGGMDARVLVRAVEHALERLRSAAGGAVPAFWALAQLRDAARVAQASADAFMVADAIEARARAIHAEDLARCQRIGEHGAPLVPDGAAVLTLGHHGALATGGWGTALGVLRSAARAGRRVRAVVAEGRPSGDGARRAAWELEREGFDVTVVPDAATAGLIARGEVALVVLGAERVAADGAVVTDVGAYAVALAAAAAAVPLLVATAAAAIDPAASLAVEAAPADAVRAACAPLPERVAARCATSDVVPPALIGAIVTERGVHRAPYATSLR